MKKLITSLGILFLSLEARSEIAFTASTHGNHEKFSPGISYSMDHEEIKSRSTVGMRFNINTFTGYYKYETNNTFVMGGGLGAVRIDDADYLKFSLIGGIKIVNEDKFSFEIGVEDEAIHAGKIRTSLSPYLCFGLGI